MHCHSKIFQDDEYISDYMKEIHKFPILEEGEEFELARNWIKNKDRADAVFCSRITSP